MTKNEIVQYLKENKNKGVAFDFMPEEVQVWVKNNPRELCVYGQLIESTNYEWIRSGSEKQLYRDCLYSLPEDFKLREKPESGWVEFEIDQKSRDFLVKAETENPNDCDEYYGWFEVERFLKDSVENDRGYTAFGGWRYPGSKTWDMSMQITNGDNSYHSFYYDDYKGVQPAIPAKIRFWREKK